MTKRLFIFAAYDKDCVIDDTLLHYLQNLSKFGDIVFTMDNDTPKSEMDKLSKIPAILHADAVRHNEYDFGSYKRGYIWAHDKKIINKYDWVYLVNDSVYGPLFDLDRALEKLETSGADLTGMVSSEINRFPPHVQSWFVGLSKNVAGSDFLHDFLINVKHQEGKHLVVLNYEVRLSRLIIERGYKMFVLFNDKDAVIYQHPNPVLNAGVPFVKKATMQEIYEIEFLTPYTTEQFIQYIINYAKRHNKPYRITHKPYKKIYRLTLFGVPLFSILKKQTSWGTTDYKFVLFDLISLFKFVKSK